MATTTDEGSPRNDDTNLDMEPTRSHDTTYVVDSEQDNASGSCTKVDIDTRTTTHPLSRRLSFLAKLRSIAKSGAATKVTRPAAIRPKTPLPNDNHRTHDIRVETSSSDCSNTHANDEGNIETHVNGPFPTPTDSISDSHHGHDSKSPSDDIDNNGDNSQHQCHDVLGLVANDNPIEDEITVRHRPKRSSTTTAPSSSSCESMSQASSRSRVNWDGQTPPPAYTHVNSDSPNSDHSSDGNRSTNDTRNSTNNDIELSLKPVKELLAETATAYDNPSHTNGDSSNIDTNHGGSVGDITADSRDSEGPIKYSTEYLNNLRRLMPPSIEPVKDLTRHWPPEIVGGQDEQGQGAVSLPTAESWQERGDFPSCRSVFVGNMPQSLTKCVQDQQEHRLEELALKFGPVRSIRCIKNDKYDSMCAFINFERLEDAVRMHSTECLRFDGNILDLGFADCEEDIISEDTTKEGMPSITSPLQETDALSEVKDEATTVPGSTVPDEQADSDVFKKIKVLLQDQNTLVNLSSLLLLFKQRFGTTIDYKAMGFKKLRNLVEAIPGIELRSTSQTGFEVTLSKPLGSEPHSNLEEETGVKLLRSDNVKKVKRLSGLEEFMVAIPGVSGANSAVSLSDGAQSQVSQGTPQNALSETMWADRLAAWIYSQPGHTVLATQLSQWPEYKQFKEAVGKFKLFCAKHPDKLTWLQDDNPAKNAVAALSQADSELGLQVSQPHNTFSEESWADRLANWIHAQPGHKVETGQLSRWPELENFKEIVSVKIKIFCKNHQGKLTWLQSENAVAATSKTDRAVTRKVDSAVYKINTSKVRQKMMHNLNAANGSGLNASQLAKGTSFFFILKGINDQLAKAGLDQSVILASAILSRIKGIKASQEYHNGKMTTRYYPDLSKEGISLLGAPRTDAQVTGQNTTELEGKAIHSTSPPAATGPMICTLQFQGTSMRAVLLDNTEHFNAVVDSKEFIDGVKEGSVVAVDCEGVPDCLHILQLATKAAVYVFDCVQLKPDFVCEKLSGILASPTVTKLFHDLHNDASAISNIGGMPWSMKGTFDTQLAMELLTGALHMGFGTMLEELQLEEHPLKTKFKKMMNGSWSESTSSLFQKRPMPRDVLEYAAYDVALLMVCEERLREQLGEPGHWDLVQRSSDERAADAANGAGGVRLVSFDQSNGYAMGSAQLLRNMHGESAYECPPLQVSDDTEALFSLLQDDIGSQLQPLATALSEVALDLGQRPLAWVDGDRLLLGADDREVDQSELDAIIERLGGFGQDNRAGIPRQLHRVSAIRNRSGTVVGLTMRVGRHVQGGVAMLSDILLGDNKSILFLGEPGSGKTTLVREVSRLLAMTENVCIVDTSNEIAGDGDIRHPCVGYARRMMVPSLAEQGNVMIECVQNHTPSVMIIDEIGRPAEVEAARTCKQRGVRMIASAHGDLRKLIKNRQLRGVLGGVETVTLGDSQAKAEAQKMGRSSVNKLKAQRAGSPVFDVVVEVRRGLHLECGVILDTANAVDAVLDRLPFRAQRRVQEKAGGAIRLTLEHR